MIKSFTVAVEDIGEDQRICQGHQYVQFTVKMFQYSNDLSGADEFSESIKELISNTHERVTQVSKVVDQTFQYNENVEDHQGRSKTKHQHTRATQEETKKRHEMRYSTASQSKSTVVIAVTVRFAFASVHLGIADHVVVESPPQGSVPGDVTGFIYGMSLSHTSISVYSRVPEERFPRTIFGKHGFLGSRIRKSKWSFAIQGKQSGENGSSTYVYLTTSLLPICLSSITRLTP